MSEHQYGFQQNRSTTTLLLQAIDDWTLSLEHRDSVHCLFLDYAKAFDSVPHEHLLLKLESFGISGNLLEWMRSFLTKRFQRVVVNGSYSDWVPVSSGVPQGSVLGPLLFLLYVDELTTIPKVCKLKLFADDVLLYVSVKSVKDCQLLQKDLSAIVEWSKLWQLNLNPRKCEALSITNKKKPIIFTYFIGDQPVKWTNLVKYLGIHINSKLQWSTQCQIVAAKATRILNVLRRTMFGCDSEAKCRAYKAIVRPLMEYACVVWSPHTAKDVNLLEAVQRRAARWACGSRWDPSTCSWSLSHDTCYQKLHLPALCTRRDYLSVCTFQDIRHNGSVPFLNYCTYNTLPTRSHYLSVIPPLSTINARRYSYFVRVCFIWNQVPLDVLKIENRTSFRHAAFKHFCCTSN